jgi:hypothetical protein
MEKDDGELMREKAKFWGMMALGVVLLLISASLTLDVMSRQCHGQCFMQSDRGCQERCHDKGLCPMAGGDQDAR